MQWTEGGRDENIMVDRYDVRLLLTSASQIGRRQAAAPPQAPEEVKEENILDEERCAALSSQSDSLPGDHAAATNAPTEAPTLYQSCPASVWLTILAAKCGCCRRGCGRWGRRSKG